MNSTEKTWRVFRISEIFDVFTGASISQNKFKEGPVPRVTATDTNNGVGLFTEKMDDNNYRLFNNFISVSFLGSIFYHEYEASLDMKIHGLKVKNRSLNENLAHFLITCLKSSLPKASYGNQLSSKDIVTKSVLLPVNEQCAPDWEYMEEYTRNIFGQIKSRVPSDFLE